MRLYIVLTESNRPEQRPEPKVYQCLKLAAVLLLCGMGLSCSGAGEKDRERRELKSNAVDLIKVEEGRPSWGGLVIGMAREDLEAVIGKELSLRLYPSPACGGYFADIGFRGASLSLQFSGNDPGAVLQSIIIRFPESGSEMAKGERIAALKERVPGLIYLPSKRRPGLSESENPTPLYLLPTNKKMAVLVNPETGLFLSRLECLNR
jgi:hypothetical protein